LALVAARQGMLMNFSEIASLCGVDVTTIQSWVSLLEENGILRRIEPYSSNLNKRLTKTPKVYFEDVALAVRLQGWTDANPLILSLQFGFLLETIALSEITRFFMSRGEIPRVFHLRNKEKVEVDFLVELPNQKFIAIEVKSTANPFTTYQSQLIETLGLNIVDRWIVTPEANSNLPGVVPFINIYNRLLDFFH
jgi:predicted AAA+ superfamily ATPase